jgi:transposase-like protein
MLLENVIYYWQYTQPYWRRKKMTKQEVITADKFCDNKECSDYGKMNNGNIIGFGHSPSGVQRYMCKTCDMTFTETKGTIFYGRHTPRKDILESLAMLAERMSIAAVARVKGVKEDTVSSWLREAANHVEEIEEALLKDYHVDKAQMDS